MSRENDHMDPHQRRVQEVLRELPEQRPDPAYRAAVREAFLTGTIDAERPAAAMPPIRRPHWTRWISWALAPAAAAAVLLLVFLSRGPTWTVHRVHGQGEIVVDGETVPLDDADRLAGAVGPGRWLELGADADLEIRCGDLALIEVTQGSRVTVPNRPGRWTGRSMRGDVASGEIRVMSGPAFAGHSLHLFTPEGRIDLTGTIVSIFRNEELTCVCVLEGEAMIGEDDEHLDAVPEGMRKVMFSDGRPSLISEYAPEHVEGLREFQERNRTVFDD